ncbi:MAG: hypothetical protein IPI33_02575 [Dehalococcoidia bacterium]|uniref:hypothetical protein n=1 Tax=Candidatus Amarobacter glycogenicus TaxID=3140699 RepID=UPI001D35C0F9|nr:hypothetical protein [Dehalococcoidia bacterium]MBK6560231.1 hypothetical protein [Dehalococcoidia bacterium]MBK7125832.1 hypothetical protein [Dehalococcoidia bacterium]MBK7724160.1 hypothetical protein [Dehalococcoidia bacterium]MBK8559408.1 hypothetical protein [Dehalococcoidia bacterium]
MDRKQKVAALVSRAEEARRLALDELDAVARKTSTWGSSDHRSARERVERDCDQANQRAQTLDEEALDRELAR